MSKPVVAGYEIVRVLGHGGMGVVWRGGRAPSRAPGRAQSAAHGAKTSEARAQVATEAKLAARIAHPGIVPIHDFGLTLDDEPYFTMDLVEGLDLFEVLARGRLETRRALRIAAAAICSRLRRLTSAELRIATSSPATLSLGPTTILEFSTSASPP